MKKKCLSILLCLCMALSLLPTMAGAVSALPVSDTDIAAIGLNGEIAPQLTNIGDTLTYKTGGAATTVTLTKTAATEYTLTLDGASIDVGETGRAISLSMPTGSRLTVKLRGTNTLKGSMSFVGSDITPILQPADGASAPSLSITHEEISGNPIALCSDTSLTVTGGVTLTLTTDTGIAINTQHSLTIENGARVTATAGSAHAIEAGSLQVNNATVNAANRGGGGTVYTSGEVKAENGAKVTVTNAGNGVAIYSRGITVTGTGTELTAKNTSNIDGRGLLQLPENPVTVNGGTLNLSGGESSFITDLVVQNSGTVNIAPATTLLFDHTIVGNTALLVNTGGNSGTINNNGKVFIKVSTDTEASSTIAEVCALNLRGTGHVVTQVSTTTRYYTNTGTPLKSVDSLSFDSSHVLQPAPTTGCGYTWNAADNTLTLENVALGTLALDHNAPDSVKIVVSGSVVITDKIDPISRGASLALDISGNAADTLSVNSINALPNNSAITLTGLTAFFGNISLYETPHDLTLANAAVTVSSINLNHSGATSNGLVLKDSSTLTVNGLGSGGISAGQIYLIDDDSRIYLNSGYITTSDSTNTADNLSAVPSYCLLGSRYRLSDFNEFDSHSIGGCRVLVDTHNTADPADDTPVTGITLQRNPGAPEPPETPETPETPTPPADSGEPEYRVTVTTPVNGTLAVSRTLAEAGDVVTVTTAPSANYTLSTLTVLDRNDRQLKLTDKGNGKFSFRMPSSNVTVSASYTLLPSFDDVDPDDFFYRPVRWAVTNGITDGIGGGKFGPDLTCTRAQIVTFLYRTSGQPSAKITEMPFTDVAPNSFYYDAVLWAVETGITRGTSDTTFSPDLTCTREQAVTFLYRYAVLNGVDVSIGEDTNILSYTDALEVSDFAIPAMQWAVGAGIVQGADGKLMPLSNCTRGQIVTMLYRANA